MRLIYRLIITSSTILGFFAASLPANAQIPPPKDPSDMLSGPYTGTSYSPYAGRSFPTFPLWGDTHLHTGNSFDAGAFGARLTPEDAYRFARGDEVVSSTGIPVRLSRPLDWLVVSDHSDNVGFFADLFAGKPSILSDPQGRDWYDRIKAGDGPGVAYEMIGLFANGNFPDSLMYWPDTPEFKSVWQRNIEAAEDYNDPGQFTAFIGYEWTSLITGNNMHRVVIYRDGADKASQMVPYTTYAPYGSINPRDLWKWLESYENKTGGDVLALAHNGNLANGIMFPVRAQYAVRQWQFSGFPDVLARHTGVQVSLAAKYRGRGGLQRSRAIYCVHRLRVDVSHNRQQHASRRDLSRRRGQSVTDGAVHNLRTLRQYKPARLVEVARVIRKQNRRRCSGART